MRTVSDSSETNLHLKACFQSRSSGVAERDKAVDSGIKGDSNPFKNLIKYFSLGNIGDWPSGKAVDSGSTIGGSNPSSPANIKRPAQRRSFYICCGCGLLRSMLKALGFGHQASAQELIPSTGVDVRFPHTDASGEHAAAEMDPESSSG